MFLLVCPAQLLRNERKSIQVINKENKMANFPVSRSGEREKVNPPSTPGIATPPPPVLPGTAKAAAVFPTQFTNYLPFNSQQSKEREPVDHSPVSPHSTQPVANYSNFASFASFSQNAPGGMGPRTAQPLSVATSPQPVSQFSKPPARTREREEVG